MDTKSHWDAIFEKKPSSQLGWFQPHLSSSLELLSRADLPKESSIIDVGGGDSTLVDDLLAQGHDDITVLDVSRAALARARSRLGLRAERVRWIEGDILDTALPERHYHLWHDRALFHFLVEEADRALYVAKLIASLAPAGRVIFATFAPDGPSQCSGLPTMRYAPADLLSLLGTGFELEASLSEDHVMPSGAHQRFAYAMLRSSA